MLGRIDVKNIGNIYLPSICPNIISYTFPFSPLISKKSNNIVEEKVQKKSYKPIVKR